MKFILLVVGIQELLFKFLLSSNIGSVLEGVNFFYLSRRVPSKLSQVLQNIWHEGKDDEHDDSNHSVTKTLPKDSKSRS